MRVSILPSGFAVPRAVRRWTCAGLPLLCGAPLQALAPQSESAQRAEVAPRIGIPQDHDARSDYDVQAYWIDLRVRPDDQSIAGRVCIEFQVVADVLPRLALDMDASLRPRSVRRWSQDVEQARAAWPDAGSADQAPDTRALPFQHRGDALEVELPEPLTRGQRGTVCVEYAGEPRAVDDFDGFHWERTASGQPWITTSFQALGAHRWWPCKASYFHPEDKPARLAVDLTVPTGLYAVSNGRLTERRTASDGWETFRWTHPYPLETYAVTLDVAPYVLLESTLDLPGCSAPVPWIAYVLPEDVEKARVQFAELPDVLACYSRAFGPWPFPESKVALVQTSFWGMEHSTAVAYGSSFPAWLALHGGRDPFAARNRWFDYILVHETSHEWWGNAVSAADWGDFWLHEGFATYSEGVWVESRDGRDKADQFFAEMARSVPRRGSLYRGRGKNAAQAYSPLLYAKGALVLNTLRHCIDDDEAWWKCLRTFFARHCYGNASTADFQRVVEEVTGRSWQRFFDEWVRGNGTPRLDGEVRATARSIVVDVTNAPPGDNGFLVPLDLAWAEEGRTRRERLWIEPGTQSVTIPTAGTPQDLRVEHLDRVLGRHDVRAR